MFLKEEKERMIIIITVMHSDCYCMMMPTSCRRFSQDIGRRKKNAINQCSQSHYFSSRIERSCRWKERMMTTWRFR